MKRTVKRILSTLLIVVMLIGIAPIGGIDFAPKAKAMDLSSYKVGDLIEFGSYPQSEVKDSDLITKIEAAGENEAWVDYNYYAGTGEDSDGNMKPVEGMMLYKDISCCENMYRAVWIRMYRPFNSFSTSSALNTWQDDNGYYMGNVYYFKYEPLTWKILDPSEGYVMCNQIIDSQAYQNFIYYNGEESYNSKDCMAYASDWITSSLRQWLNYDFYNSAFTAEEKAQISTSHLENKSTYSSKYDSADTYDKIFPISYYDVIRTSYGFNPSNYAYDPARQIKGTDYARCQGIEGLSSTQSYYKDPFWQLRSPSRSGGVISVDCHGLVLHGSITLSVGITSLGVVPAFKFNPKSTICDVHEYKTVVTEPTCTEQGYTTYTCTKCNDSYVDNYTNALGHDFGEWKLTTPATCTEIGVETRYCSRCNVTQTRDVDKSAHVFDEWKITTAPTTISDGVKTRYCKNCDASETESVGKLKSISVKLNNIETNYKKSGQFEPKITNPDNVGYKVEYKSSDPKCVIVDAVGNYFAVKTGSAKITCTVTDEYGKVTTAECKVNVKYSTVQWIIIIVLFGWIWY